MPPKPPKPGEKVWGLTAKEYANQHGGQGGDLCVDEDDEERCLNDKGSGRYTWKRGREKFGHGSAAPRLRNTCSGPCRIPGHPGPRGAPAPGPTDWAKLDQLGNTLYRRRGDLGLSEAVSLPVAKPGLLVATETAPGTAPGAANRSTAETPATLLTGTSGPEDHVVLLYYKLPPNADPREWLEHNHPDVAQCSQSLWLWTPPDRTRIFPVSAFGGVVSHAAAGPGTKTGLGSMGMRAGFSASREFAKAYAAAWGITPAAAVQRWLWLYDNIVAVEWRNFDADRLTGQCAGTGAHDVHNVLQFLTADGMPPADQVTAVAGGQLPHNLPPVPPAADGKYVNQIGRGAKGSFNNSVIVVINNGHYLGGGRLPAGVGPKPGAGGAAATGAGAAPAPAPGPAPPPAADRQDWSWWLRRSMQRISSKHGAAVAARRLLKVGTTERNAGIKWLINDRGLTYATGMSPDEYIAAADTQANRDRFGRAIGIAGPPVTGDYPSAEWASRIPYALAPIATIMCLDQQERRDLLK
jgi:hypothetical protein